MKDPKHKEHKSYKEWWGGIYDPDAFDIEGTNEILQEIDEIEWWEDM